MQAFSTVEALDTRMRYVLISGLIPEDDIYLIVHLQSERVRLIWIILQMQTSCPRPVHSQIWQKRAP